MIEYSDVLTIGWADQTLDIDLFGYGMTTPSTVQNVTINMVNENAQVSWDAVTQTINGDQLIPTGYIVYYSTNPYEVKSFFDFVETTEIVHHQVGLFNNQKYYSVSAYKGDFEELRQVIEENPNFKKGELERLLNQFRKSK